MTRIDDIPDAFDERTIVLQMLQYVQETAVLKVSGLSQEAARTSPMESSPLTSPANVLNHLRWVERWWVNHILFDHDDDAPWTEENPDADFSQGSELPLDEVVSLYEAEAKRTRAVFADVDLDTVRLHVKFPQPVTARWIAMHLIEETARHNGHLDILRELADGTTGD